MGSRLTITVAAVVAVLSASCSSNTAPAPALAVAITLNRTSVRAGDTVVVDVQALNASPNQLQVDGSACPAHVEIRDGADRVVQFSNLRICSMVKYPPITLASGQVLRDVVTLGAAPVGLYRIRAGIPAPGVDGFIFSGFTSLAVVAP